MSPKHPPFQENAPKIGKWELAVTGVSVCLFPFDCSLSFSKSYYIYIYLRSLALTNTEILKWFKDPYLSPPNKWWPLTDAWWIHVVSISNQWMRFFNMKLLTSICWSKCKEFDVVCVWGLKNFFCLLNCLKWLSLKELISWKKILKYLAESHFLFFYYNYYHYYFFF